MQFQRILLIDDDEEDQEIFLSAVDQIGAAAACDCFSDATLALARLTTGQAIPDVIFLDLNMPVMDGPQFLQHIKQSKELQNIPVIIFSTSSDPLTIGRMKEMGAFDFITKPSSFDELVEILEPLIS